MPRYFYDASVMTQENARLIGRPNHLVPVNMAHGDQWLTPLQSFMSVAYDATDFTKRTALNCRNCGAPPRELSSRCEYCETIY